MSVDLTLKVVQVFREFGVPVTFEPGWEWRGNGLTSAYKGGILHHTGTASANYANPSPTTRILRDGRSDLPGPLCNFQGCFDGRVHVIAAHPANHAGASGGYNTWPLPVTRLFNPAVFGFEADYPGATPMSPELRKASLVYAIAMWRIFGTVQVLRAHAETSIEGKWDPGYASGKTIDMNAFRAEAVQLAEEGDMPLSQADIKAIANEVWVTPLLNQADGYVAPSNEWLIAANAFAYAARNNSAALLERAVADVDEAELARQLSALGITGATPAQVKQVFVEVLRHGTDKESA